MTNKEIRQIISEVCENKMSVEEHTDFLQWIDQNTSLIEEGFFDKAKEFLQSIPERFREAMGLIKELAKKAGAKIKEVINLFKNEHIYHFFRSIGWNIGLMARAVKIAMRKWTEVRQMLIDKLISLKPLEWVKRHWGQICREIDKWWKKLFPTIGGFILAGMLIWIWFSMTFTGDFHYDFDNQLIIDTLKNTAGFADCFQNNFDLFILLTIGLTTGGAAIWGVQTVAMNAVRLTISMIYSILLKYKDTPTMIQFRSIFSKQDGYVPPKKSVNVRKPITMTEAKRLLDLEIEKKQEADASAQVAVV